MQWVILLIIYGEYATARKLYDNMHKAIKSLKTAPYRSTPIRFTRIKNIIEYRKCVVGKYIIFYSIHENIDSVYVERVIHGTRDWMNML